ncbi:MAG: hypothetical protein EOP48_01940 [Sphingobacteriales bacterium]|nr:MAG: hypothetical protein EOP48_01940 [Sphingobacteriales bacterium]
MVTIKVDVLNGTAPIPIRVFINHLENDGDDFKFAKNESFEESFDLNPGEYSILITGKNNHSASTEITVSGECIKGPVPDETQKRDKGSYAVLFNLEV